MLFTCTSRLVRVSSYLLYWTAEALLTCNIAPICTIGGRDSDTVRQSSEGYHSCPRRPRGFRVGRRFEAIFTQAYQEAPRTKGLQQEDPI